MRRYGRLTTIPDNLPVPNGTAGEVKLMVDDSVIGNVSTTDGWYEYSQDGNPGPFYIEWDYSDVVHEEYSAVTGPSGPVDIAGLPLVLRSLSNGYIPGMGAELLPTATGSSMSITVGSGGALVQGILYDQEASRNLTITAAHATLPRIDRIIGRVVPAGAGETIEGRSELVILPGTPISGATAANALGAATLTQTPALWEIEIGRVEVGAAATVIASDKVFRFASPVSVVTLPDDSVGSAQIQDNSVTSAHVVDGTLQTADYKDRSVTDPKIATPAINTEHIYADAIDGTKIGAVNLADLNDVISTVPAVGEILKRVDILGVKFWAPQPLGAGVDVLMPGSEYVATGNISAGTRLLVTMGIGPLISGVQYAIFAYHGVTLRNNVNTGTVAVRCQIASGAIRTHEFQNVGGVPRWAPVIQSAVVTGTGASIDIKGSVQFLSPDTTDVRAGWIFAVALPLSIVEAA